MDSASDAIVSDDPVVDAVLQDYIKMRAEFANKTKCNKQPLAMTVAELYTRYVRRAAMHASAVAEREKAEKRIAELEEELACVKWKKQPSKSGASSSSKGNR